MAQGGGGIIRHRGRSKRPRDACCSTTRVDRRPDPFFSKRWGCRQSTKTVAKDEDEDDEVKANDNDKNKDSRRIKKMKTRTRRRKRQVQKTI
jgi:hypothetical protein